MFVQTPLPLAKRYVKAKLAQQRQSAVAVGTTSNLPSTFQAIDSLAPRSTIKRTLVLLLPPGRLFDSCQSFGPWVLFLAPASTSKEQRPSLAPPHYHAFERMTRKLVSRTIFAYHFHARPMVLKFGTVRVHSTRFVGSKRVNFRGSDR